MDREPGHLPFDVKDKVSSLIWIKAVAAGNAGVGKTCIIKHFCEDKVSYFVFFCFCKVGFILGLMKCFKYQVCIFGKIYMAKGDLH